MQQFKAYLQVGASLLSSASGWATFQCRTQWTDRPGSPSEGSKNTKHSPDSLHFLAEDSDALVFWAAPLPGQTELLLVFGVLLFQSLELQESRNQDGQKVRKCLRSVSEQTVCLTPVIPATLCCLITPSVPTIYSHINPNGHCSTVQDSYTASSRRLCPQSVWTCSWAHAVTFITQSCFNEVRGPENHRPPTVFRSCAQRFLQILWLLMMEF